MTNPTPDFRTELARLVDLYYALGGNWSPHGYTDTWNDALASARIALATPPPEPPTACEVAELVAELRKTAAKLHNDQYYTGARIMRSAAELLERTATPPPEPPTDEELWAMGEDYLDDTDRTYAIKFARAALERWGHA